MTDKQKKWVYIRSAFMLGALIYGYFFFEASMSGNYTEANWGFFFKMMGVVAVSIVVILGLSVPGARSNKTWCKPSWRLSPFVFNQPLVVFDFASSYFLFTGAGCFLKGFFSSPKSWVWEFPISIGVGVFLGVKSILLIYGDRL